jgi:transposase-like protein
MRKAGKRSWNGFESGLTPENGLKMVVSDGGTGFEAAYQNMYAQRCVFHKLKNLALKLAQDLDPQGNSPLISCVPLPAFQAIHLYRLL